MCFLARNVSTYRGCDTTVILQYRTNPNTDNLQLPPSKVQHDSTSYSMPLEHSSAWQKEPPLYTRDGRVERLDRNASVKRDWNAEQATAMPVNHKAVGLSFTNGNGLGHRSKHRVQGRQNGFYTDNGKYSTPAARGAEPAAFLGAPSSVESNLAWKFENDYFHVGSGAAVLNPVFNGSRSIDYRVKDVGDWHTQDPYVSPPVNGRDSSVMIDQRFRPFHVHGFVESDSCLVDQECFKLVSGSANNLELSHRTSRDHRDKQQSKYDLYSRKRGAFGHFDSGKDWIRYNYNK